MKKNKEKQIINKTKKQKQKQNQKQNILNPLWVKSTKALPLQFI